MNKIRTTLYDIVKSKFILCDINRISDVYCVEMEINHNNAGKLKNDNATLHLIVYKDIIDKIFSGEKTIEYRIATEYWEKRIVGGWTKNGFTQKRYDLLRITNGYGNDTRPYILLKYPGYTRVMKKINGDTIPTQHYAIPIDRELWLEYRKEINGEVRKV